MLTLSDDGKYVDYQGSRWFASPYVSLDSLKNLVNKLNCPRFIKQVHSGLLWVAERVPNGTVGRSTYVNFTTWEFDEDFIFGSDSNVVPSLYGFQERSSLGAES